MKANFEAVYLFLVHGINPNLLDSRTGTSVLHEAIRFDENKDKKANHARFKMIKYLTLYGANPELENYKNEVTYDLLISNFYLKQNKK